MGVERRHQFGMVLNIMLEQQKVLGIFKALKKLREVGDNSVIKLSSMSTMSCIDLDEKIRSRTGGVHEIKAPGKST